MALQLIISAGKLFYSCGVEELKAWSPSVLHLILRTLRSFWEPDQRDLI